MIACTNKTYFLRDTLIMWHMQARQKVLGQNVDLGLVSSRSAQANQTQVNICSPQILDYTVLFHTAFVSTKVHFTILSYTIICFT